MSRHSLKKGRALLCAAVLLGMGLTPGAMAGDVKLTAKGKANCVVVAPEGWAKDLELPGEPPHGSNLPALGPKPERVLKLRHDMFRGAVKDLAHYLGRMSGTEIEIVEGLPAKDKRIPIYVGAEAEKVFGPVGISKAGLFGFRVVANRKGIGLYGESRVGTSYAVYELLHRLGCRWFMPTELGEVVPELPDLTVPAMDEKIAPATEQRGMWHGGADFLRRNRMSKSPLGPVVWIRAGDGSLSYILRGTITAKTHPHLFYKGHLRLTHPEVADHVANQIFKMLERTYGMMRKYGLRPGFGLTPPDGQVLTEDPEEKKHDPEPRVWEAAAGRWSVTDRCQVLINRVAKKVRAKYPDVAFNDYAYVNKALPPAKQAVPKDFTITICPIDFNRHHPMNQPNHVNEYWLRDLVQGWNKTGARLSAYWYAINLAEISAPCPFITKLGTDVPLLMENNLQEWWPETMNGWDTMMPGYVLASRISFYPQETPEAILQDLWTKFYGAAAEPMARYWNRMDRAYVDGKEYAGSPYIYLKIFTPEVMKAGRADLDEALAACKTPMEYRRVLLIDESFGLFEWYMKMRTDWAEGRLAGLDADYATWRHGVRAMQRKYGVIGRFVIDPKGPRDHGPTMGHVGGRHGNPRWSDTMYSLGYKAGAKMAQEYKQHGKPMLEWKWKHNPGPETDSLPWAAPDFDDKDWPTTHVVRDTWSSLGHHFSMTDEAAGKSGRMAYRTSRKLKPAPKGKKVYLWIGATDGRAKVFVNGKHIKYVVPETTRWQKAGTVLDAFDGYCQSARFDVTDALKAGDNQITILAERHRLNELGTGGLIGPVMLYREK